jgi:hypothetical protein
MPYVSGLDLEKDGGPGRSRTADQRFRKRIIPPHSLIYSTTWLLPDMRIFYKSDAISCLLDSLTDSKKLISKYPSCGVLIAYCCAMLSGRFSQAGIRKVVLIAVIAE